MSKKYTYEEVKEIINNLGYELISKEYVNCKNKLILKDKFGYFYELSFDTLNNNKNKGINKFDQSNPFTLTNIKLWLKLNNTLLKLVSNEYINNKKKLTLKDDDGYFYYCCLSVIQQKHNSGKYNKSNPYTIQNLKLWCKLNNKEFELVSETHEGNNKKLQWKCLKDGCGQIFNMTWSDILQDHGCGVCSGRQVGLSNCLATLNPELAKEWHPTKNGELTPYDVSENSGKNVWWLCSKNSKHEWKTKIDNRSKEDGTGCPYCSGKEPSEDYNLLVVSPSLCEEWNYDKNDKNPEEYTPNADQKVWWKCRECKHEWEAKILARNSWCFTGCPECNESKGEKEIKEWFNLNHKYYIPQKEFEGLMGLGGKLLSYDFYLPNYNLLIEYQGEFHKKKQYKRHNFEKQQEHDRRK